MPIIKSAQKRMRQEITRRARNRQVKDELRKQTKELRAAVEAKDKKKANELFKSVTSQLDKAVKKNLLHENNAARKKSQANALVKSISGSAKKSTSTAKKSTTKKSSSAKSTTKKSTAKKAPAKKSSTKKSSAKKSTSKK